MTTYIDEYGRYRASSTQNVKITTPTYQYWMEVFGGPQTSGTPASAAPVTSGTPIEENERDSERQTNGGPDGGDVSDVRGQARDQREYDNFASMMNDPDFQKDWNSVLDIVTVSPSRGALEVTGLADKARDMMGFGGKEFNGLSSDETVAAGSSSSDDPNAEMNVDTPSGGQAPGEVAGGATDRDSGDPDGIGLAEGGEVMFKSTTDVPGEVAGPGGPKDDAVPANLSDGEYVNTAEAVTSFGQPFFDQVNQIAKMPGAPSLMTNPDFQKMQNEFLTGAAEIAQTPAAGNVAPANGMNAPASTPGLMTPPPGMPEEQMPMQMAEGGVVPSPKGGGLMNSTEDFFDWLMSKWSKMTNRNTPAVQNGEMWSPATESELEKARKGMPERKMSLEEYKKHFNVSNTGATEDDKFSMSPKSSEEMAKSAPKTAETKGSGTSKTTVDINPTRALSLARRAIPGVGTAAAIMESSPTNEGEEEMMAEAMKDPQAAMGNVKESRTKGDMEMPFLTKESKPSLASKPNKTKTTTKPISKKKETPATENKLASDASLGDALEFYKRKDAPGFVFKGETYERSARSPSGYVQV